MSTETTPQPDPTVARVRALMERKGWNQAQVSRYLGVPSSTVGNWLQGKRAPAESVARLLTVLGMVEALAPGLHASLVPAPPGKDPAPQ